MVRPVIGERVSHFEILELLGRGGMGVVYKARDLKLERLVALKFLAPHLRAAADAEEGFLNEARAASALDHPNICTVYEIGETESGRLFIAMAYYEGETLDRRLERGPLPSREACAVAIQVGRGLAAAHAQGLVHRDVKPGNIVVTLGGIAKLLDFGLATLAGKARTSDAGTPSGTVAYLAPEQARGERLDARADIWSLGVVLHEMLTGELPFRGGHPQVVLHAILNQEPRELPAEAGGPPELDAILRKALAKDPEDRHRSAKELVAELSAVTPEEPPTLVMPARDGAAPQRGPVLSMARVAGALVLAGLLVGLLLWWRWQRSPPAIHPPGAETTVAVLPFSYRGSEEYEYLGQGLVDLLSADLDGAGEVRAIDPRAVLGLTASENAGVDGPAGGRDAAERLQAEHFVLGSAVEIGGTLQLQAVLYSVEEEGKPRRRASVEGGVAATFDLVDELAIQLLGGLGQGFAPLMDRVAAVTTSSLPAFKAYLEGESAFRRGQFHASVEAFRRAVELDEQFALAWYRLSMAYEWLGTPQELHLEAAAQASRHADRLTDREKRLLKALRIWRQGANQEARQLYRAILHEYPDEIEAWYQLGEVLFHRNGLYGRPFTESREAFERVLTFEPEHFPSLVHLARIEAFEDRHDAMDALVERFLELGRSERTLLLRALRAFAIDDPGLREEVLAELREADGTSLAMAFLEVSLFARDLDGAEEIARLLAGESRPARVRSYGHVALAHLHLAHGRLAAAERELDLLLELDPWASLEFRALFAALPFVPRTRGELASTRAALAALDPASVPQIEDPQVFLDVHHAIHPLLRTYLLGLLSARMGDVESAARHAAEIPSQQFPPAYESLAADLQASVGAQIDRVKGKPASGLARLEGILSETKNPLESPFVAEAYERFTRAQLLVELGRYEEALPWYEHIAESSVFEFLYLPVSFLWRGEIYDRLGQHERARASYMRFIDFWHDCDPELRPMVELARERLEELAPDAVRRAA